MAQTSIGFDGTVDTIQWATLSMYLGCDYCVNASTSLKGTAVGGARTVTVAAGSAFGRGVLTTLSASENVPLATPAAGQWYLIVLRRVWATKVTSLVAIPHTTTTTATPTDYPLTYPAARLANPGVQDDQPLLWAWANASNTTLVLVDLRDMPIDSDRTGDATARDAFWGTPTTEPAQRRLHRIGARWIRTDLGVIEQYMGASSAGALPGGLAAAGWYPVEGALPALSARTNQGQTLTSAATDIIFSAPPTPVVARGVTFNGATGVMTVVSPGLYRVQGQISVNAGTAGVRVLYIYINGAVYLASLQSLSALGTLFIAADIQLAAGDTVKLVALSTGSNVTIPVAGSSYWQQLSVSYLGPA